MYYKRHVSVDWYPFIELNLYVVFDKSHTVCYQFIIHGSDE